MTQERFKITPAVFLILIHDNKILLLRSINTGYKDGEYTVPSGHLEGNETIRQATAREAQEEAGIRVNSNKLKLVHVMNRKTPQRERVDFFFTIDTWEGEAKNTEPDKCDDLQWFLLDNLPDNTIDHVKLALRDYQNGILYSEFGF